MGTKISKRKLESYKRAELVCRELRHQLSDQRNADPSRLAKFCIYWYRISDRNGQIRPEKVPNV